MHLGTSFGPAPTLKERIPILVLSLSIFILAPSHVFAETEKIIGYGYSDAVLPATNQELFYMGFEVGFNSVMGKQASKDKVMLTRVTGGSQMGAYSAASDFIADKNIVALVGFPTSHEAMLVAKLAQSNHILSVTAGSSHSGLASFGNTVFSTGEPMTASVSAMIDFVAKTFPKQRGLVLSNSAAVFSKNQEMIIRDEVEKKNGKVTLEYSTVNSNLNLNEKTLQKLKNGEYKFICLTLYPDESTKLFDQLNLGGIDLPIVTSSSWNAGDIESIRRFITKRKSPFYSASPWSKSSSAWKAFEKKVSESYGRVPTSEMAYGYDVGIVIAQSLKRVKGPVTRKSLVDAFHSNRCFEGTSAGRLCFPKDGGHADRQIYMTKFTKVEFVELQQAKE